MVTQSMVWRHISCNHDKLPFKICYKYRELQKKWLLLDLICEFQTYVSVKLDLPCCVGVYTLWRPDEDWATGCVVGHVVCMPSRKEGWCHWPAAQKSMYYVCGVGASQQFILVPFVHGFNNFRISSTGPNSCLLLSMCVAYAEVRLLCLM